LQKSKSEKATQGTLFHFFLKIGFFIYRPVVAGRGAVVAGRCERKRRRLRLRALADFSFAF